MNVARLAMPIQREPRLYRASQAPSLLGKAGMSPSQVDSPIMAGLPHKKTCIESGLMVIRRSRSARRSRRRSWMYTLLPIECGSRVGIGKCSDSWGIGAHAPRHIWFSRVSVEMVDAPLTCSTSMAACHETRQA